MLDVGCGIGLVDGYLTRRLPLCRRDRCVRGGARGREGRAPGGLLHLVGAGSRGARVGILRRGLRRVRSAPPRREHARRVRGRTDPRPAARRAGSRLRAQPVQPADPSRRQPGHVRLRRSAASLRAGGVVVRGRRPRAGAVRLHDVPAGAREACTTDRGATRPAPASAPSTRSSAARPIRDRGSRDRATVRTSRSRLELRLPARRHRRRLVPLPAGNAGSALVPVGRGDARADGRACAAGSAAAPRLRRHVHRRAHVLRRGGLLGLRDRSPVAARGDAALLRRLRRRRASTSRRGSPHRSPRRCSRSRSWSGASRTTRLRCRPGSTSSSRPSASPR